MEPVSRSEVLDIGAYEKIRSQFRTELMALKARRRVLVGPSLNFMFENRRTVLYQIQEMVRVERIVEEKAIAHEVETYNALLPPAGGISASLFIEYDDPQARAEQLAKLLGLEDHVRLLVRGLPAVQARFDRKQMEEARISSVQYVVFPLADEHRRAWREAAREGTLRLGVDHPHYSHEARIPPEVAESLAEDFS